MFHCDICQLEFKNKGALASHARVHQPKRQKATIEDLIEVLVERLPSPDAPEIRSVEGNVGYVCKACGNALEPVPDGPMGLGDYKLRCIRCWEDS